MFCRKKVSLIYGAIVIVCLCLSGCKTVVDSVYYDATTSRKQKDADVKKMLENPNLPIDEAEQESKGEVYWSIKRQEESEEAARKKKFDDFWEKQMQRSQ